MSAPIALPGLHAASPAAALALYGIAQLLAPTGTVRWTADRVAGWHAEAAVDGCADLDGLVERLVGEITRDPLTGMGALAKDVNELVPETWYAAVVGGGSVADVVTGLCAEAPLRSGGRVALTPLCVYSFGTRGTLFGNVVKQDAAVREQDLRGVLAGSWQPKANCNTLGLDPMARRQDGAIMGPDPSADGVRGVPGLVPLMIRGLAVVAPMPGTDRPHGGAFERGAGRELEFRWPVFTRSTGADVLPLMTGRDWVSRSQAARTASGVEAVFAARIVRAERRLSTGRRVA